MIPRPCNFHVQFPASLVTHMENPVENADNQKRIECLEFLKLPTTGM